MSDLRQSQRKCCGCLTIKTGAYLSAAYAMLVSLLGVIGCILMVKVYLPMAAEKAADIIIEEKPENAKSFTREELVDLAKSATWAYWVALGLYAAWFFVSLMLIIGVSSRRRGLMLGFIIFTCIVKGLFGIALINALINAKTTFANTTGVFEVLIFVLIIILNIYAVWCVAVHMRELREAECSGAVITAPRIVFDTAPGMPGNNYKRMYDEA